MTPDDATLVALMFDAAFYLAEYPDVRPAGVDPLQHFCTYGWREGRRPNAAFDSAWYGATYPDAAGSNPLVHYARQGERAGNRASAAFDPAGYRRFVGIARRHSALADFVARCTGALPLPKSFDAAWYLQHYSDVAAAGLNPFAHYVVYGAAEGRTPRPDEAIIAPSELFDPSYYLIGAPDVGEHGDDPLIHFCLYGWREGRKPNPYFDPVWYRRTHLAGVPQPMNPLAHFVLHGEARDLPPCAWFDTGWYRRTYRLAAGASPLRHYLAHRRSQRFSPTPWFDHVFYLREHAERIGPNRDPFAHFLVHGAGQDLDPSPTFNAAAYRATHMPPPDAALAARRSVEEENPLLHFLLHRDGTAPPLSAQPRLDQPE
jgi:hypothetical protein